MLDNLCSNQSEPLILLKRQYLENSSCKMFFSCATVIYKRVRYHITLSLSREGEFVNDYATCYCNMGQNCKSDYEGEGGKNYVICE